MKRIWLISMVVGLLLAGAVAAHPASFANLPDLSTYLVLQRERTPGAVVCSGFYDWRSLSIYRRHAGLHLGYDVAMPQGSPVVAGWTGQVTRITPWLGDQFGITVMAPSGFETTYGHLSPRCRVGDVLNAGDLVGVTLIDHVDLKMRAPDGAYFDPGHGTPPVSVLPRARTQAEELAAYVNAFRSARATEEEMRVAVDAEARGQAALEDEKRAVEEARKALPRLRQYLREDMVARTEVERAEARARQAASRLSTLEANLRMSRRGYADRKLRWDASRLEVAACHDRLRAMGVTEAELKKAVEGLARRTPPTHAAHPSVARARAEMQRLEALFAEDAVSANEVERARENYRIALRAGGDER